MSGWSPAEDRYEHFDYPRSGASGLRLPPISLGLWQNFGEGRDEQVMGDIVRTAFDAGITHFDLANNYGPPPGAAESFFGRMLADDLAGHRDELVISTKAGWDMWPGPYGSIGGSRKYLVASLDQSLERMGLDYVDIFYHHRWVDDCPLEETMLALDQVVRAGKTLYVGISSYNAAQTRRAAAIAKDLRLPLVIHQPSYSMLNRWIEQPHVDQSSGEDAGSLVEACAELGLGIIPFSPLQQGLLTDRYLHGIPEGSRASQGGSLRPDQVDEATLSVVRELNEVAAGRGQSLAAMALAWALRDPRITSVIIGASSVDQLRTNLAALDNRQFSEDELQRIDLVLTEGQDD